MAREREAKARDGHEVEFSRIVAFSDGVFSIAITLLVLNLTIKTGIAEDHLGHVLLEKRDNLLAYGISFAVIGRLWVVHHGFFSEVRAFDSRLMALNMFYLAWVVLIPFSSQVLGDYGGQLPAIVVYSANMTGVTLVGLWMSWDARRDGLTTIDAETAAQSVFRAIFIAGVFVLSVVVALFDAGVAQIVWLLLFVEGRSHVFGRLAGVREGEGRDDRDGPGDGS